MHRTMDRTGASKGNVNHEDDAGIVGDTRAIKTEYDIETCKVKQEPAEEETEYDAGCTVPHGDIDKVDIKVECERVWSDSDTDSADSSVSTDRTQSVHTATSSKRVDLKKNVDTQKGLECNVCMKKFRYASTLNQHLRVHSGDKPFECKICLKKFAATSHLQTHLRLHSGEKPFECNICMKTFSLPGDLKRHERIHSGEKPFQCNICSKKFAHSSNLKTHKRIHFGEKRFECEICMKKFVQMSNLNTHKRIHIDWENPF